MGLLYGPILDGCLNKSILDLSICAEKTVSYNPSSLFPLQLGAGDTTGYDFGVSPAQIRSIICFASKKNNYSILIHCKDVHS